MDFKVGMVVAYRNENYVILDKKTVPLDKDKTDTFFEIKNLITQTTLLVNQNQIQSIDINKVRNNARKLENISEVAKPEEKTITRPTAIDETIANLKVVGEFPTSEFIPKRLQKTNPEPIINKPVTNDFEGLNDPTRKTTFVEPISITNDQELEPIEEDDFAPNTMRINNINLANNIEKPQPAVKEFHSTKEHHSRTDDSQMFLNSFDNPELTEAYVSQTGQTPNRKNNRVNFSQETRLLFNQPAESGSDILKKSKVYRSFRHMTTWLIASFTAVLVFTIVVVALHFTLKTKLTHNLTIIGLPTAWAIFLFYFFVYIVYNLIRQYKKIAHYHYQLTKSNRSVKELRKQMDEEKLRFSKLYKNFKDFETDFYQVNTKIDSNNKSIEKKQIIN